jgi:rod shape-determining protein MreC
VGILADNRIQPGEKVLTAGGDLIFPRGLPVGVGEKVVRDPDRDSFIDVMVKPAAHLEQLDEVLAITDTEPRFSAQDQQDLATSEALKGEEAAAVKEQKKAAEILAERLPTLVDPNLPADQQPLHDSTNPSNVAHPPQALHPDRFTPVGAASAAAGTDAGSAPNDTGKPAQTKSQTGSQSAPESNSAPKPKKPKPQENP